MLLLKSNIYKLTFTLSSSMNLTTQWVEFVGAIFFVVALFIALLIPTEYSYIFAFICGCAMGRAHLRWTKNKSSFFQLYFFEFIVFLGIMLGSWTAWIPGLLAVFIGGILISYKLHVKHVISSVEF